MNELTKVPLSNKLAMLQSRIAKVRATLSSASASAADAETAPACLSLNPAP